MKRRLPRDQEKERADQAGLMRAWRAFHIEQLNEALAGAHGAIVAELMDVLDRIELNSDATLLNFMQRTDWGPVSYEVRLTALHQINESICGLRARHGLAPIDDPLPGQPDNVFRRVKNALFPSSPGSPGPRIPGQEIASGRGVTAAVLTNDECNDE